MPIKVDKEFKDYWNPAVSIFNDTLKAYGFNLEMRYGDGIRDLGFKLYVTPDEGRAVAVAEGVSPWNLIHNIYYIRNSHPRVKDYICLYQSPAGLRVLDVCLRDINSKLEKIGFKISKKYNGR